jgi:hypothetical protein
MKQLYFIASLLLLISFDTANADSVCNRSSPSPTLATCYYVRETPEPLYKRFLASFAVPNNGAYRIALLGGVSEYKDKRIPSLIWAHNDMIKLFNVLRDQHLFDEIIVLENNEFSLGNLSAWLNGPLQDRIKSRNGVQFLFGFSGHGISRTIATNRVSGMLLVQDSDQDHLEAGAISLDVLKALLDPIVAGSFQSLILINSCYSGNLFQSSFATGIYDKNRRGAHIITAGDQGELTFPTSNSIGAGSVFFDAFIEGLRGNADLPSGGGRDGIITVDEIARYVIEKVEVWTGDTQHPRFDNFGFSSAGGFFFWSENDQLDQKHISRRREFSTMDKSFGVTFGVYADPNLVSPNKGGPGERSINDEDESMPRFPAIVPVGPQFRNLQPSTPAFEKFPPFPPLSGYSQSPHILPDPRFSPGAAVPADRRNFDVDLGPPPGSATAPRTGDR